MHTKIKKLLGILKNIHHAIQHNLRILEVTVFRSWLNERRTFRKMDRSQYTNEHNRTYNRLSFSVLLILLCCFTFGNRIFAFGYFSNDEKSFSSSPTKDYGVSISNAPKKKNTDIQKIEYVNYFKEDAGKDISFASNVKINHISKDLDFKEDLTVEKYQTQIKDVLKKKYPDLNTESIDSMYFFRALAENTYSLDGCLLATTFNTIVDDRATYLKIDEYINTLKIDPKIKKSLKELYIVACIYMRKVKESVQSLKALTKIPSNSVLYKLKDHPVKSFPLGEYVGGETGENLYYICASFYNRFTELPKKSQQKVLDKIYSFNPTLMIAEPIRANYNFYYWILDSIFPPEKPELLKYCMHPHTAWLILPKTIDIDQLNIKS